MGSTRRQFIHRTAGSSAVMVLGSHVPDCWLQAAEQSAVGDERVLVVVQLSGGNDGLNTVAPHSDDAYRKARPTLALSKDDVLTIDRDQGFHPEMQGFAKLLEAGKLAVVQGVGYANPNRSHFESMDIWHTCHRQLQKQSLGWLGRLLDASKQETSDVVGMHLGREKQPLALAARHVRVPSVKSLEEFKLQAGGSEALRATIKALSQPRGTQGDLLGFVQSSTASALTASERVEAAGKSYQTKTSYPDSELARKLRVVAQLIDAGLKTRIYYVELGGFDTHAQQQNAHAVLLRQWSDAVTAFVDDVSAQGHGQRVLVMSFSEFGRRVSENASQGTDHGAAAPMFLAGAPVRPGLIGKQPSLTDLHDGDLKHAIDFRQVYATVIDRWLQGSSEALLGKRYTHVDLLA